MRKNILLATLAGLCLVGITACQKGEEEKHQMKDLFLSLKSWAGIAALALSYQNLAAAELVNPESTIFERNIEYSNPDDQHLRWSVPAANQEGILVGQRYVVAGE